VEKVLPSPVNHDIQKPSTAKNGFGEKNPNPKNKKNNQPGGAEGLVLVPRPYSSCHGITFRALAMCFVPWHCASCRGNALHAVTMFFLLWHCAMCRGVVLHAAALYYVQQCRSSCCGNALHAVARLWLAWHCSPCHGKKQCAAALHGVLRHHFFMPQQKGPTAAFCSMSRHAAVLLFMLQSYFFLPRQETTCQSILRHCSMFCSKKQHAAPFRALCIISRHGASCHGIVCCATAMFCHHTTTRIWEKNNQPVWHSSKD